MAGGDLLGISVSGANAAQRALVTTGHNIANASTKGYSRQRADLITREPLLAGNVAIGTGVIVQDVTRIYDSFVLDQMRDNASLSKSFDTSHAYTSQVDNMLADPKAGLSPALQSFFAAVNGVANDPASISARQVMLSEARSLSDRFGYLYTRFETIRDTVNKNMGTVAGEINELAHAVATLNKKLIRAKQSTSGTVNDLLDQRDRLIQELSEKIGVRTSEQEDGSVNVFIGNGQTLVVGSIASELTMEFSDHDPRVVEVVFKGPGGSSIVTDFLTGGELGGLIEFRKGILDTSQNELGRIAIGVVKTFNAHHISGMDLNSQLGGNFFTEVDKLSPKALPSAKNEGDQKIDISISDIDKLTVSDYQLIYRDGAYNLIRVDDEKLIGVYSSMPQEIESEGFTLSIGFGSIQEGDKYILRPTREAGNDIDVVIRNAAEIAAASPIRTEASIGNLGDAKITTVRGDDITIPAFKAAEGEMPQALTIRFIDDKHFEVLDSKGHRIKTARVLSAGKATPGADEFLKDHTERTIPASPGEAGDVDALSSLESAMVYNKKTGIEFSMNLGGRESGTRLRITGTPKAGDIFKVEFNQDGVSDNTNALELADLQNKPLLSGGTTNYSQAYAQLVSRVGSKAHELEINRDAQQILLNSSIEEREAISGVNLDEEAANMMRYQNMYQANAQVIAVANRLFETLIATFR